MTNELAPYSEAVTEGSKTVGKFLDLVKEAGQPVANAYGLVIGDRIQVWRDRNLDSMMRRTKEILKERDLAETAAVAEQIAIPILEAAQADPRPEMQEIWATLLANAMDPARRDEVRQEFIAVLRSFHPTDAVVLKGMNDSYPTGFVQPNTVAGQLGLREASVAVSMRNLQLYSCVTVTANGGAYHITPFGIELVRACTA